MSAERRVTRLRRYRVPPSPSAGLTQLPTSARPGNTHTQYGWVADRDASGARGGRRVSADGRGPDHIGHGWQTERSW